jgi:hypothetical protein
MPPKPVKNLSLKKQPPAVTQFYTEVLDEAEKLDFETAAGLEGVDAEITLLRLKIKQILAADSQNTRLIMAAANTLAKLVKTRYSISQKQEKGLGEAIRRIITDIGVPLGVTMIQKKV